MLPKPKLSYPQRKSGGKGLAVGLTKREEKLVLERENLRNAGGSSLMLCYWLLTTNGQNEL